VSLLFLSLGCHPLEGITPHFFLPVWPRLSTILCIVTMEGVTRGSPPPVKPLTFDRYKNWWLWTTLNRVVGLFCVISPKFDIFGANHVKVSDVRPILFAKKSNPKNLVLSNIWLMAIFKEITEDECVNKMHSFVRGDNWHCAITEKWCERGLSYDHSLIAYTGFRLVSKLVTLNDLEWRNDR